MSTVSVKRFWLQATKSFAEGAPQRESYLDDRSYDRACVAYADEWRREYRCAGCVEVNCPQCGAQGVCERTGNDRLRGQRAGDRHASCLDGAGTPRGVRMIHVEPANGTCGACGETQRVLSMTFGTATVLLCRGCGVEAGRLIGDRLLILDSSVPSGDQVTSDVVASFATYPHDLLLDDLVMCTVRYNVGPLNADERRIATALLERLAALGIMRKVHRSGCEIWPKYRLCDCPWERLS